MTAGRGARTILLILGVTALVTGGCGGLRSPVLGGIEVGLPNTGRLWDPSEPCAGVGLDAILRGDPNDPSVTWLENRLQPPPDRLEILWPAGFRARFAPHLEVIGADNEVVHREGDAITEACVGADGALLLPTPG